MIHALARLGDPDTSPPRWGSLPAIFERLASKGEAVREELPSFEETLFGDAPARFHHRLLGAVHRTNFDLLIDSLITPGPLPRNGYPKYTTSYGELAAHIRSLSGEGALTWHLQCPFSDRIKLTPEQTRRAVRFELGLPQPGLEQPEQPATAAAATMHATSMLATRAKTIGHATLTQKRNTAKGGTYYTHNVIVQSLINIVNDIGIDINAHDSCAGLLGSREHLPDSDTVADLCITGLDPYFNGLVVDVSFTHPISGKGAAKGNADHVKGHAAATTENAKIRNYTAVCREARYGFSPPSSSRRMASWRRKPSSSSTASRLSRQTEGLVFSTWLPGTTHARIKDAFTQNGPANYPSRVLKQSPTA